MSAVTDVTWATWPEYSVIPLTLQEPSQPRDDPTVAYVVAIGVHGPPPGLGCLRPRTPEHARQQAKMGMGWLVAACGLLAYAGIWQMAEWVFGLARWVGGW